MVHVIHVKLTLCLPDLVTRVESLESLVTDSVGTWWRSLAKAEGLR